MLSEQKGTLGTITLQVIARALDITNYWEAYDGLLPRDTPANGTPPRGPPSSHPILNLMLLLAQFQISRHFYRQLPGMLQFVPCL
jgi:hypothetical protein